MLYVIIILIILVLFLFVRLMLIKKELKRVTKDMKNNPGNNPMNMDFIDRDLQKMITEVNALYDRIMGIKAEGKAPDRKIERGSIAARQVVLHLADGLMTEQTNSRCFVLPHLRKGINEVAERQGGQQNVKVGGVGFIGMIGLIGVIESDGQCQHHV